MLDLTMCLTLSIPDMHVAHTTFIVAIVVLHGHTYSKDILMTSMTVLPHNTTDYETVHLYRHDQPKTVQPLNFKLHVVNLNAQHMPQLVH